MHEVRERHGVVLAQEDRGHVTAFERRDKGIGIVIGKDDSSVIVQITPDEADYLASKLRRLAKKQRGFQV